MIKITIEQFEQLLPFVEAASEDVFTKMQPSFEVAYNELVEQVVGMEFADKATQPESELLAPIRCHVIRSTFLDRMHSQDIIMTDNGFGVVSNDNIAPASQARVDALESELTYQRDYNKHQVIYLLRKVDGWSESDQAQATIRSLVWSPVILSSWCGVGGRLTFDDLSKHRKDITASEAFLRQQFSDALMDELIGEERKNKFAPSHQAAKLKMLDFIGANIDSNRQESSFPNASAVFENLHRFIEENIADFPKYMNSSAYRANHMQAYENKSDDTTFFFAG